MGAPGTHRRIGGAVLSVFAVPLLAGAEVRVVREVREVIAGGSVALQGQDRVRAPAAGEAHARPLQCASQAARGRPHLGASSGSGA